MYYTYACTYCERIFYTFDDDKWAASQRLYDEIKKHLISYNEDDREHKLDDGRYEDSTEIYNEIGELNEKPENGYYEV